jgi:ParE toxin of type II toxin-antitoxin system, parDE
VLEVLEAASLELSEAAAWYDDRVTGLGDRFLSEVREAFDFIARYPAAGSPWLLAGIPPGVRHVPLRIFPYSVVYVMDPRLVVVAVAAASQEPTYWIDRLDNLAGDR